MPVVPGSGDGGRGAAVVAGQLRLRAVVGLQFKGVRLGGSVNDLVVLGHPFSHIDVADGDHIVRRAVADLEAQEQLVILAELRRGELLVDVVGSVIRDAQVVIAVKIALAPVIVVVVFGSTVGVEHLKALNGLVRMERGFDQIFFALFRRDAGADEEMRAPQSAIVPGRIHLQLGDAAGHRGFAGKSVIGFQACGDGDLLRGEALGNRYRLRIAGHGIGEAGQ